MKLTEEQMKRLEPYKAFLHTAHYAGYVTGMNSKKVMEIFSIYNELREQHLNEQNVSCNSCVVEACAWLGLHYFSPENQKEAVSEPQKEGVDKVPTTRKKTHQRGRKSTKNGNSQRKV